MAKPKNNTPIPAPVIPVVPPVPVPQAVAKATEPGFRVEAQPMEDRGKGWYILLINIYGKSQDGDVWKFGMTSTYRIQYRLMPSAPPVLDYIYDIFFGTSGVARVEVFVPPAEKSYDANVHYQLSCKDRILMENRQKELPLQSAEPQRGIVEPGSGVRAHFLRHMR